MTYTPVKLVHVSLDSGDKRQKIGRLALEDRRIYFEYDANFLQSGLEISPFKLPLKSGVTVCEDSIFEGLFGVFNDSLPDGWGRLLLDRQVRRHGIVPEQLTPLDRLTHVGQHGMGALLYEPDVSEHTTADHTINLDYLADETAQVLEGEREVEDMVAELLELSGSSSGARPKIMVGVSADKKHLVHGGYTLPQGFSHWMVKFTSAADPKDIGAVEYAYSLMARAAGVDMMPSYLFPAKKGGGYFGVERFDRQGDSLLHMHTVSGLLHADHRLPSLDYESVLRAGLALTHSVKEVEKLFRLATFNVFAHNRDDHAKNISFLMNADGLWSAAPAYDLSFSSGPAGEHSTTIMGQGKAPGVEHLRKLAEKFSIDCADIIIDQVRAAIASWSTFADEAGVSKASRVHIGKVLLSSGEFRRKLLN